MMKLFCRQKIVLCISAQQMLAAVWQGKKLLLHLKFTQDEIGVQAFTKFLKQHSHAVCYLILDVPEEDYQQQVLPHSTGRTEKSLLSRKLAQVYRDVLFSTAVRIEREHNLPKKDVYLFAAVINTPSLQRWLMLLESSPCALAGVYLLPMLTEKLLHFKLIAPPQNSEYFLITERLNSGLRQTYLLRGHLRMSRLLSHEPAGHIWDSFYQTETEKFKLYLLSQRLIEADAMMHTISLNHHIDASYLSHQSKQLKLPLDAMQTMPELAHMQLLINGVRPANLAPSAFTQKQQQQRIKLQFGILSFASLLMSTVFSVHLLHEGLQLSAESTLLNAQIAAAQQTLHQRKLHSHTLTSQARKLQQIVDAANQISALPASPLHMMQVLSASFSKMSGDASAINLKTMAWSFKQTEPPQISYESAMLRFETNSASKMQAYAEHLQHDPGVAAVEIVNAPNTALQQTIQGSTATDASDANAMQSYEMHVKLKPQNDRQP